MLVLSQSQQIYKMDGKDSSNIGDKQFELRRKQWEALFEKYERRGEINTDDCCFSEINYKMFIKPSLKVKKNKWKGKKRINPKINRHSTEAIYPVEAEETSNSVSSTDAFTNVNYETESADSGLEMSDKAEQIPETYTSSKTFINIDVSEIIDEGDDITFTEMCNLIEQNDCIEVHSTVNCKMDTLIYYIETDLKSNLKVMLRNRSVSKLLEYDDYSYWHECSKREMTRLEKYISRNDLKAYMRHCYNADIPEYISVNLIQDVIVHKLKSNIKKLFLKREFSKNDKNKYLKYRKRIIIEWQRLCETIPVDYLLLYGTNILFSIEELKERTLSPNKKTRN